MGIEGGNLYPRTEKIRNNIQAISARAEEMATSLKKRDEQKGTPNYSIGEMFVLTPEARESLTNEEIQDIENFIAFATKRIAAASLASPMSDELYRTHGAGAVLKETSLGTPVRHDVLHSIVAYARTHGESLTPVFLQLDSEKEQYSNHASVQEELTVLLFDKGEYNFMYNLLATGDPIASARKASANLSPYDASMFESEMERLKPLQESDPVEFLMSAWEALYFSDDQSRALLTEEELLALKKYIKENRSPEHIQLVRNLYENSQAENPDPKILISEFRRLTGPLLERLRTNPDLR